VNIISSKTRGFSFRRYFQRYLLAALYQSNARHLIALGTLLISLFFLDEFIRMKKYRKLSSSFVQELQLALSTRPYCCLIFSHMYGTISTWSY